MTDPAWVALSLVKHLGGKTFRNLLIHFNHDLHAILHADETELTAVPSIGKKIAQAITHINLDDISRAIDYWDEQGITLLTWDDPQFPANLRALDDAPLTLFVCGDLPRFDRAAAVVGTRNATEESRQITQQIASSLAEQGYVIVSGLAEGIDTAAHMAALSVPEGVTVAVLGSGLMNLYPPSNRGLAQGIMQRGAFFCEVSPQAGVSAPGLVARNRLITGLCEAVIIVQTETDGGAMHAARFARMQGKRLYTVDLPATGNQALIADGIPVLDPDDIALVQSDY